MSVTNFVVRFLMLLVLAPATRRDPFQIVERSGVETFYVAYSSVKVLDAQRRPVFKGTTDKYGRIRIDLPNGSYEAELIYRHRRWTVTLTVDGHQQLKTVTLS